MLQTLTGKKLRGKIDRLIYNIFVSAQRLRCTKPDAEIDSKAESINTLGPWKPNYFNINQGNGCPVLTLSLILQDLGWELSFAIHLFSSKQKWKGASLLVSQHSPRCYCSQQALDKQNSKKIISNNHIFQFYHRLSPLPPPNVRKRRFLNNSALRNTSINPAKDRLII